MNPGETPGLIVTSVVDSHVGRDVVITNNIGVSEEGVAARVVAAILEHKLLSLSSSPEFSDEQKAIAHRAIQSADAIVKANAAIVLGQPTEARAHLAAAAHVTDETFRYFTAVRAHVQLQHRAHVDLQRSPARRSSVSTCSR